MLPVLFLIALALALFWFLPWGFALAGAVVIGLLVAAKLRDALHYGRLVVARRKRDDSTEAVINDMHRRDTMFYALWIGLTVANTGHAHDGHHGHGGDMGGDIGGFDGGGGAGDSGGGGGF